MLIMPKYIVLVNLSKLYTCHYLCRLKFIGSRKRYNLIHLSQRTYFGIWGGFSLKPEGATCHFLLISNYYWLSAIKWQFSKCPNGSTLPATCVYISTSHSALILQIGTQFLSCCCRLFSRTKKFCVCCSGIHSEFWVHILKSQLSVFFILTLLIAVVHKIAAL